MENNEKKKRQKFYFSDFDEECAYTLDYIVDEMKERGLTECEVAVAVKDPDKDHFFCKVAQEAYAKPPIGDPCGSECWDYEPRNGKSGCCKFRGNCYVSGDEFKLTVDGILTQKYS